MEQPGSETSWLIRRQRWKRRKSSRWQEDPIFGLNVMYDAEGYACQVDDDGDIVPDEEEDDAATLNQNIHKNR